MARNDNNNRQGRTMIKPYPQVRFIPLLAVLLLGACSREAATGTSSSSNSPDTLPDVEWRSHGFDFGETRYSPLADINTDNIGRLGLAWSFGTGVVRGHEATPLVVDGVLYATRPWSSVFALDARTGELLWDHDPQVDRRMGWKACCDVVNRGVAV